jgi:hypothetical protein
MVLVCGSLQNLHKKAEEKRDCDQQMCVESAFAAADAIWQLTLQAGVDGRRQTGTGRAKALSLHLLQQLQRQVPPAAHNSHNRRSCHTGHYQQQEGSCNCTPQH